MGFRNELRKLIGISEFSADNCRKHQEQGLLKRANLIIEDIKALINYKVTNTNEKAVIYSITDSKIFEVIKMYFSERGFKVFVTQFQELGCYEFLVISWLPDEHPAIEVIEENTV